jgi:catechol 2,3-dioxygenase-like lactoylglutathione lyase family enzyme
MRLVHLNLTVADVERSLEFYRAWFGFDRPPRAYPDGAVFVNDAGGFDLALHPRGSGVHFGFRCDEPGEVRALRDTLAAAGVPITEAYDEDGYVNLKCLDPDGYEVEVYWEPPPPG